jgi:hypothetical protein
MGVGAHVFERRFDSACCTVGGPHSFHLLLSDTVQYIYSFFFVVVSAAGCKSHTSQIGDQVCITYLSQTVIWLSPATFGVYDTSNYISGGWAAHLSL